MAWNTHIEQLEAVNRDPLDAELANLDSTAQTIAASSLWPPQKLSEVQGHITGFFKTCRKLRRTYEAGQIEKAARLERRLLRSYPARLCGELHQHRYGKVAGKKPAGKKTTPLSLDDLQKRIDANPLAGRYADPAIVHIVTKANGKSRVIVSPGPRTRAGQWVLAIVLDARGIGNPFEYNCAGRGRDAAVRAITKLALEHGCRTFVVFDLANYFSSVKPTHLKRLNWPKEVKDHLVFFTRKCVLFTRGPSNTTTNGSILSKVRSARQGLPQGAVVSGQIASTLLGQELHHIGGGMGKVTYVDDGVIGAGSPAEAEQIAKALRQRLTKLRGGPIGFTKLQISDIREGFEFLGYWIRLREGEEGVHVKITPSHSAKQKFRRRLFARLKRGGKALDLDERLVIMEQYRLRWLRAFRLWAPDDAALQDFFDETFIWVDDFGNGYLKKIKPYLSG